LITDHVATLEEVERFWSLDDVLRAHAALNVKAAMLNISLPKDKE
jgi:hypothetical protein